MRDEEQVLKEIQQHIATQSNPARIEALAARLRAMIREEPIEGALAVALVGAEMAARP